MFVQRDPSGTIIGVFAAQQMPDQEFLADDHSEMVAFRKRLERAMFPPISDRQFFQALAMQGLITKDAALAAVQTGEIPEPLASFVAQITDPNEHFAAVMLLSGATEFRRDHPLVDAFAHEAGMTPEDIDQIWHIAATL